MPKKILVALPTGLLEQVDAVARAEHRTRSDLIREALRRYNDSFKRVLPTVPQMSITTSDVPKISMLTEVE